MELGGDENAPTTVMAAGSKVVVVVSTVTMLVHSGNFMVREGDSDRCMLLW